MSKKVISLYEEGEEVPSVTLGGPEEKKKKSNGGFFKKLFAALGDPQVQEGMKEITKTLNSHL